MKTMLECLLDAEESKRDMQEEYLYTVGKILLARRHFATHHKIVQRVHKSGRSATQSLHSMAICRERLKYWKDYYKWLFGKPFNE